MLRQETSSVLAAETGIEAEDEVESEAETKAWRRIGIGRIPKKPASGAFLMAVDPVSLLFGYFPHIPAGRKTWKRPGRSSYPNNRGHIADICRAERHDADTNTGAVTDVDAVTGVDAITDISAVTDIGAAANSHAGGSDRQCPP
ncbi:MAG TPA: hypothetical protein DD727_03005 [Clostridiales bacterium]|nr:hypothetical protein [Clostridiales bacterium]